MDTKTFYKKIIWILTCTMGFGVVRLSPTCLVWGTTSQKILKCYVSWYYSYEIKWNDLGVQKNKF